MPQQTSTFASVALCFVLVALGSGAAAKGLEPSPVDKENYTETFSFVGDMSDGAYVQVQLTISNLGPGSGHGICRALVVDAKGKSWTKNERVTSDKWRHSREEGREQLRVGPCRAIADAKGLQIFAAMDDRELRLDFAAPLRSEKPPRTSSRSVMENTSPSS